MGTRVSALLGADSVCITPRHWKLRRPTQEARDYGLLVLEVFLPKLPPGKYFVDRLQVTLDDDSEEIWDIGTLVVDVRAGVQPRDIKVGRNTLGSTTFLYWTETGNTIQDTIIIKGIQVEFEKGKPVILEPDVYPSFSAEEIDIIQGSSALTLEPGEMKCLRVEFFDPDKYREQLDVASLQPFISVQPWLVYQCEGDIHDRYYRLRFASFSPTFPSAQSIYELVRNVEKRTNR